MKRFGRVATCLLAAALSAVFAVSGYQIWAILQERQAAEASYQELDSFLQFGRSDSGTGWGSGSVNLLSGGGF